MLCLTEKEIVMGISKKSGIDKRISTGKENKKGFDVGLPKQQPAAFGVKKVGVPLKKGGTVVKHSVSDSGNPVKPLKMAAGGAAKQRKGFPKTIAPKKK